MAPQASSVDSPAASTPSRGSSTSGQGKREILSHAPQAASEELYDSDVSIEPGDVLLFSRRCLRMDPLSATICMLAKTSSWSVYDHVGIVVPGPDGLRVLEANMGGVTAYPLVDRLLRTSSYAIAVRKLIPRPSTSEMNRSLGNESSPHSLHVRNQAARELLNAELGVIAEEYLGKPYNSSFFDTSNAWSHSMYWGNARLTTLHAEFHRTVDDVALLDALTAYIKKMNPSTEWNGSHVKALEQLRRQLLDRVEKQNEELNRLTESYATTKPDINDKPTKKSVPVVHSNADDLLRQVDIAKKRPPSHEYGVTHYFCSQVVSEILQRLYLLNTHRSPKQYIPADFSSTTQGQMLLPRVHSDGLGLYFTFGPDIDLGPLRNLVVLKNSTDRLVLAQGKKPEKDSKKENTETISEEESTEKSLESVPSSCTDKEALARIGTTDGTLDLHIGDGLDASLVNWWANHRQGMALRVTGEVHLWGQHGELKGILRPYNSKTSFGLSDKEWDLLNAYQLESLMATGEKISLTAYDMAKLSWVTSSEAPASSSEKFKNTTQLVLLERCYALLLREIETAFSGTSETADLLKILPSTITSQRSPDLREAQVRGWISNKTVGPGEMIDLETMLSDIASKTSSKEDKKPMKNSLILPLLFTVPAYSLSSFWKSPVTTATRPHPTSGIYKPVNITPQGTSMNCTVNLARAFHHKLSSRPVRGSLYASCALAAFSVTAVVSAQYQSSISSPR